MAPRRRSTAVRALSTKLDEPHEVAKKVALAASELPMEIVLSMVLEGLHILQHYNSRRALIGSAAALREVMDFPRPLLTLYSRIVHDFVMVHDMDSEESAEQLGATVSESANQVLLPDGANLPNAIPGVGCKAAGASGSDSNYYHMLLEVRKALEATITLDDGEEDELGVSGGNFALPNTCRTAGGIEESLFCTFVAPALTLSLDENMNRRFIARTNVTQSGLISWEAFSNFFVKLHADTHEETTNVQFIAPVGDTQHNAAVRRLLFTRGRPNASSPNAAMDRYCVSGGYDGTVHVWDTAFYDHICRLHFIPSANKARRWINDMSFTGNGRLAVAQSRGIVYLYSVMNPQKAFLHRVFRSSSVLSSDEEQTIRNDIERIRLQQGKTRYTAADIPHAEMCVMSSPLPGDVVTIHGPGRIGKFSLQGHMEPLLVGLDTGLVHLYNVFKPIEFRAQIAPMQTFSGFGKGEVFQVMDNNADNNYLCAGRSARGASSIQVVDYEKSEVVLTMSHPNSHYTSSALGSYTRFDFDETVGLLIASGSSRSATVFSTSFPDPVTVLSEHGAPIVGGSIHAAQYRMYTVTEDLTFHLFDTRMFRKVQTFTDSHSSDRLPGSVFSAGGFDGNRATAVAATSTPVALHIQAKDTQLVGPKNAGSGKATHERGGELRSVTFTEAYQTLIFSVGSHLIHRTCEVLDKDESVVSLRDSVIHHVLDPSERKTAMLLSGKVVQIISTVGANRLQRWTYDGTPGTSDEGTAVCFAIRSEGDTVVLVGTQHGHLDVFSSTEDGERLFEYQFSSGVVCIRAVAELQARALVGLINGDVFLVFLDAFGVAKISSYELSHGISSPGVPGSDGSTFEAGDRPILPALPLASRRRRSSVSAGSIVTDDLAAFQSRSFAAMDRAVEAACDGFEPGFNFVLYGTGLVLLIRVVHEEGAVILDFPALPPHCSGSALAASNAETNLVAVGDFSGCVTLFRVQKAKSVLTKQQTLQHKLPESRRSSLRRENSASRWSAHTGEHLPDYDVQFEMKWAASSTGFISSLAFMPREGESMLLAVAVSEDRVILVVNLLGYVVQSIATSPSHPPPMSFTELIDLPVAPVDENTHPFFLAQAMRAAPDRERNGSRLCGGDALAASLLRCSEHETNGAPAGVLVARSTTVDRQRRSCHASAETSAAYVSMDTAEPGGAEVVVDGKTTTHSKPVFAMPKTTPRVSSASPRGRSQFSYPVTPQQLSEGGISLGSNIFFLGGGVLHPASSSAGIAPTNEATPRTTSSPPASASRSRPATARDIVGGGGTVSERLYRAPQPPDASTARPGSSKRMLGLHTQVSAEPLIQYRDLRPNPSFVTRDVDRLRPPAYCEATERTARPPAPPIFQYQRKTAEMSKQTDKMLQDAVDKANQISTRIVSNLRQRRLIASARGSTGGDDRRIFLTLEQQPIPPDLVRAVTNANVNKQRK